MKERLEDCGSNTERREYHLAQLAALSGPVAPAASRSSHSYRLTGKITAGCGATQQNWNNNPKFLLDTNTGADTQVSICVSQINVRCYGHDDDYPIKLGFRVVLGSSMRRLA